MKMGGLRAPACGSTSAETCRRCGEKGSFKSSFLALLNVFLHEGIQHASFQFGWNICDSAHVLRAKYRRRRSVCQALFEEFFKKSPVLAYPPLYFPLQRHRPNLVDSFNRLQFPKYGGGYCAIDAYDREGVFGRMVPPQ